MYAQRAFTSTKLAEGGCDCKGNIQFHGRQRYRTSKDTSTPFRREVVLSFFWASSSKRLIWQIMRQQVRIQKTRLHSERILQSSAHGTVPIALISRSICSESITRFALRKRSVVKSFDVKIRVTQN